VTPFTVRPETVVVVELAAIDVLPKTIGKPLLPPEYCGMFSVPAVNVAGPLEPVVVRANGAVYEPAPLRKLFADPAELRTTPFTVSPVTAVVVELAAIGVLPRVIGNPVAPEIPQAPHDVV
jgi:hypothetical protein